MIESIKELYANLSEKDIDATNNFLQNKAIGYNPVDGENRIMAAYQIFIAKGNE